MRARPWAPSVVEAGYAVKKLTDNPPLSIVQILSVHAVARPGSAAIVAPERAPLSYARLHAHVEDVRRQLRGFGLQPRDRVAVVLPQGPELAVTFLAIAASAIFAPLNPAYRTKEFNFYLEDLDARVLIILRGMDSPVRDVAAERRIPVIEFTPAVDAEAGLFTLDGAGAGLATSKSFGGLEGDCEPGAENTALVLHTSGTTSRPKMVPLTHANMCSSAWNMRATLRLTSDDSCLNVMPLFHIHGLMVTLASLAAGASVTCPPAFAAGGFFGCLKEYRPTWYSAVPTIHQAILAEAERHSDTIRRYPLRFIRSSSAALPPPVMKKLEEVFSVPVIESYGMTEASHQMTSNPLPPAVRKPGSVGVVAGPEVAVLDEGGALLSSGDPGEVAVRGANIMRGYEHNSHANKDAFSNGWFRTGDQGYLDAEGYLFLTGRLKEMINRGGEKIAPREIDEILMQHPMVAQAVAFGAPHETLGEDVAAAVVLKSVNGATERQLQEFASARLSDFKVPRQIVFLEEIPKGPTGKIQRVGLAQKFAEHLRSTHVGPRDEIEKLLAEIWRRSLHLESVGVLDNFFSCGGDSLAAVRLVAAVNSAFGMELHPGILLQAPTIAELAQVISDGDAPLSNLVCIQAGDGRRPFFFAPNADGSLLSLVRLGRHLDPAQPLYGLSYPVPGGAAESETVEELALQAIEAMQNVQLEGGYLIGGDCFGCVVALEMARQLVEQGQQVSLLALMDPFVGPALFPSESRLVMRRVLSFFRSGHFPKPASISRFAYFKLPRFIHSMLGRVSPRLRLLEQICSLREGTCRARDRYVPSAYPGRVSFFWSTEFEGLADYHAYWKQLAVGGGDDHVIPCIHGEMGLEPSVVRLAKELSKCLDKAESGI